MFSGKWLVNTFIQVFITMIFIYLIKKISNKFDIPVVKNIANEV